MYSGAVNDDTYVEVRVIVRMSRSVVKDSRPLVCDMAGYRRIFCHHIPSQRVDEGF